MCCRNEPTSLKKCHQVLRWTMFTVNFILFCIAAIMMGYAVYLINSKWELLSHDDNIIPVIMFIAFAFIMLVTTIGALGACNLSRGFLLTYLIITILCLILEIVLVVVVAVNEMDTTSFLTNRWNDLSDNDKAWIEESFDCCGLDSDDPTSYSDECSSDDSSTATTATTSDDVTYCLTELQTWVESVQDMLMIIGAMLLVFQVSGMIVSSMLLRAMKYAERVRDDSYIEYSYYANNEV